MPETVFAAAFQLDRKAAAATAGAGRIRVVELESALVDSVEVVDHSPLHEWSKLTVHHDRNAVLLRDQVAGFVDSSIKSQRVFETAATTGFDDDSQDRSVRNVLFGDESLDLDGCLFGQSNRCFCGSWIGDVL